MLWFGDNSEVNIQTYMNVTFLSFYGVYDLKQECQTLGTHAARITHDELHYCPSFDTVQVSNAC
jgi:hypothetical protein